MKFVLLVLLAVSFSSTPASANWLKPHSIKMKTSRNLAESIFDVSIVSEGTEIEFDLSFYDLDQSTKEPTRTVRFRAAKNRNLVANDPTFSGEFACDRDCSDGAFLIHHRTKKRSQLDGDVMIHFFDHALMRANYVVDKSAASNSVEKAIASALLNNSFVRGGEIQGFRVFGGLANPYHIHIPLATGPNAAKRAQADQLVDITGSEPGPGVGALVAYSNASGTWPITADVEVDWRNRISVKIQGPSPIKQIDAYSRGSRR